MARTELEEALKERLHTRTLINKDNSASGCISKGFQYEVDNEEGIFVKINASLNCSIMFKGEFESLREIRATKTIRCPKPILVMQNYDSKENSAIVMEYLKISSLRAECAKKLGHNLALLHDYNNKVIRYNEKSSKWLGKKIPSVREPSKKANREEDSEEEEDEDDESSQFTKHCMKIKDIFISSDKPTTSAEQNDKSFADRFVPEPETEQVTEFGFNFPTCCGSIPQVNEWTKEWVPFYARHRLDKAIREILSDYGDRELTQEWSRLQLKVDKFFTQDFPVNKSILGDDDKIVPALLHGDLWSGNVAQSDGEPVIYDPSSFYGHSEYEFGIARMFGGIPKEFEVGYFEVLPKKRDFEKRNKLYQLFHHLNHWSHFGQGYRRSSLSLIKHLNSLV